MNEDFVLDTQEGSESCHHMAEVQENRWPRQFPAKASEVRQRNINPVVNQGTQLCP